MQRAMDSLDGFLKRHRRAVLAAWVVAIVAAVPFAARQTEHLSSGGFGVPGSGSKAVDNQIARFPGVSHDQLAVVLRVRDERGLRPALARVEQLVGAQDHVSLTAAAKRRALAQASRPVVVVPLELTGTRAEAANLSVELHKSIEPGVEHDGVAAYLVGQEALWAGMQDVSKQQLASAERVGFPLVLLILLVVFGSLAAAALPLALGVGSVVLTGAVIWFLSQRTAMSVFVTNTASMIGIGVAVDYSLFVLARYREEIYGGVHPDEARRRAMRTSGLAVAFSGFTVIIALAGLFVVNSQTLRSMAMGAIVVVAISILGALTLLPTLMGMLGKRAYARDRFALAIGYVLRTWRNRPRRRGSTHPDRRARPGFWERWTALVTRRPLITALLAAAVMLTLAVPALSMKWGNGALRQFPEGNSTRVGAELAGKALGPGAAAPIQLVTDEVKAVLLQRYAAQIRRDPAVAAVKPARLSRDGQAALIEVVPKADGEAPQTVALVNRLRSHPGPAGAHVDVGGATAYVYDFRDLLRGSMWKILLFVLAFSYVVLLVLLRSVLLPLKAVIMNLLSVAAAYGVLVTVFQYGWFDSVLGFNSLGFVQAMTPPLLLAITFGLSMDYEVFLLSRIRERYEATGDSRVAVAQGLAASAKTISSAALIMVAVFAVFAGTGVASVKEIGLGLAVAIALDATVVRLILVPATMELMGKWNWWLPKPLGRVLPRAAFEAPEPKTTAA
ncbi:MAG: putative drug exporter of the superfamily [Thermoleophilaceae bacterium]|jgi:RND superfamily putative drug exporter|nr:putative drug exporter of the superfamily [Thermoleophilaceae bacterium]